MKTNDWLIYVIVFLLGIIAGLKIAKGLILYNDDQRIETNYKYIYTVGEPLEYTKMNIDIGQSKTDTTYTYLIEHRRLEE